MTMDWGLILGFLFGGTSIAGIITSLIYRKENKELKKNEVKSSSAEVEEKQINNDNSQIDLGAKFLQQTLEMTEKMKEMILHSDKERDEYWEKQDKSFSELHQSVSHIAKTVTKLEKDVKEIKEEQKTEIAFLNGDYRKFKEQLSQKLEDENKKPSEIVAAKKTKPATRYVPVPKKTTRKRASKAVELV